MMPLHLDDYEIDWKDMNTNSTQNPSSNDFYSVNAMNRPQHVASQSGSSQMYSGGYNNAIQQQTTQPYSSFSTKAYSNMQQNYPPNTPPQKIARPFGNGNYQSYASPASRPVPQVSTRSFP